MAVSRKFIEHLGQHWSDRRVLGWWWWRRYRYGHVQRAAWRSCAHTQSDFSHRINGFLKQFHVLLSKYTEFNSRHKLPQINPSNSPLYTHISS